MYFADIVAVHFISNDTTPLLFPSSTKRVNPPIKDVPKIPPTQAGTIPKVDLKRTPETPPQIMFFCKGVIY